MDPILLRCTVEQLVRVEQTTPVRPPHTASGKDANPYFDCREYGITHNVSSDLPSLLFVLTASLDIWERLCFKRFVREARQCTLDHPEGPECWRAHYSVRLPSLLHILLWSHADFMLDACGERDSATSRSSKPPSI